MISQLFDLISPNATPQLPRSLGGEPRSSERSASGSPLQTGTENGSDDGSLTAFEQVASQLRTGADRDAPVAPAPNPSSVAAAMQPDADLPELPSPAAHDGLARSAQVLPPIGKRLPPRPEAPAAVVAPPLEPEQTTEPVELTSGSVTARALVEPQVAPVAEAAEGAGDSQPAAVAQPAPTLPADSVGLDPSEPLSDVGFISTPADVPATNSRPTALAEDAGVSQQPAPFAGEVRPDSDGLASSQFVPARPHARLEIEGDSLDPAGVQPASPEERRRFARAGASADRYPSAQPRDAAPPARAEFAARPFADTSSSDEQAAQRAQQPNTPAPADVQMDNPRRSVQTPLARAPAAQLRHEPATTASTSATQTTALRSDGVNDSLLASNSPQGSGAAAHSALAGVQAASQNRANKPSGDYSNRLVRSVAPSRVVRQDVAAGSTVSQQLRNPTETFAGLLHTAAEASSDGETASDGQASRSDSVVARGTPTAPSAAPRAEALPEQAIAPRAAPGSQGTTIDVSLLQQSEFAQALARGIAQRVLRGDGGDQLTIRLNPRELGEIDVTVRQNEQYSVQLQAREPATRELLEQHLPRLRQMFEDSGLALADTEVDSRDAEQREAAEDHSPRASQRGNADRVAPEVAGDPASAAAPTSPVASHLVDVRA